MSATAYRMIGTTDEQTVCDLCGKSNLRMTVVLDAGDGEYVKYGRDCAARATGWKGSALDRRVLEAQAVQRTATERLARLEATYRLPDGTLDYAAFRRNNPSLDGLRPLDWATRTLDSIIADDRATLAQLATTGRKSR